MGHTTKKKRRGSGRKGKGRPPSGDPSTTDDQDLLSEELTALSAIFQEDIQILSRSPYPHFTINLTPHSDDTGNENNNVAATLSVRCLPGYPSKCPKLQVIPNQGLKPDDVERLLSLLLDQANSNARERRVMIFNLVEAAQEFLSEVVSLQQQNGNASHSLSVVKDDLLQEGTSITWSGSDYPEESFVCGLYDLFSDLYVDNGSSQHGIGTVLNDLAKTLGGQAAVTNNVPSKQMVANDLITSFTGQNDYRLNLRPISVDATEKYQKSTAMFNPMEVIDDNTQENQNESSQISDASFGVESYGESPASISQENQAETQNACSSDSDDQIRKLSCVSMPEDTVEKKDILVAHLLRLACSTKEPLAVALSEITSELYNLGILSKKAKDLAVEPSLIFNKIFNQAFQQQMVSSPMPLFWRAGAALVQGSTAIPNSRYLSDFEEIRFLGHGAFGHVVLCKNKLDGRHYAIKKIRLKNKSSPFNEKILREVATLSRLQHQHVVRYYQAWFETEIGKNMRQTTCDSTASESSNSYFGSSTISMNGPQQQESMYLYIQMEYCPRTLRQDFESPKRFVDKDLTWHLFRQIVEGLSHIHSQGIIHRDLTPNNIFFDARNDIKIGDFGLAKFLKLEQLDQEQFFPPDTTGVSGDGTGQVGTYFYTAPEIEQGWAQINEKVDMYSLGVVFFELWHPFETAMERHIVLSDLKLKGSLPPPWITEYPEQSSLVQCLMSPIPTNRPCARELLRNALPPRMEDEWLNDVLRTIQTAEDTYAYDRVVSTIFDEDRLAMKAHRLNAERAKMARNVSSCIQYTELESGLRDIIVEVSRDTFWKHGARRLEISPINLFETQNFFNRSKAVKLLSSGGNMLELCHELRSPFVSSVVAKQILSFKRYEISWVFRRAIGRAAPNRFLQGDFDIIGGSPSVLVAETAKVVIDIATHFFLSDHIDIRLNHGQILAAIWTWVGVEETLRQSVSDVLSSLSSYAPQSAKRKSHWALIRRQLLQGLNLVKSVVDRLQAVDLRFCGPPDQSLARIRGALSPDVFTCKALDEVAALISYLRIWKIEKNISLDVLMPPEESYYRGLTFQVYVINDGNVGSMTERNLLAFGGCYDHLVQTMWDHKLTPPSAAGVSIALEKIIIHPLVDIKPLRNEPCTTVLVCSRGGGGLLEERMELVSELWEANIKADFIPFHGCSLTMHYDYASEHDIKLLIIITEAGLSQTGSFEVRNLELKKEKKVERSQLIKFINDALSSQFRSLSVWN